MSTFSPNLRLELIGTGTQAGAWGNTTNTNIGTLIEGAVSGYTVVSVTSANQALTALYGAADQSRNAMLKLTTTTTAAFAVYAPPSPKEYTVYNSTAYAATIYNATVVNGTTAAGTGVVIPAGKTMTVWSDGTNFYQQNTHLISPTLASPTLTDPALTGVPTAPTATTATNTTQIATTAFVQAIAALTLNAIYPVGTIYTATVATNPATLLGFGTWSAYGGGKCLVGYLSGSALPFGTGGATGGTADSVLVSHTHTATTTLSNTTHTHAITSGAHSHYIASVASYSQYSPAGTILNTSNYMVQMAGAGGSADEKYILIGASVLPTVGLTSSTTDTATAGNNSVTPTASTTNTTQGVTAVDQNYQPYITVYMWRRDS